MSQERNIWNDGQGLATPDLQRPCDDAAFADDRAHDVVLTPGAVLKRIVPLSEESTSLFPILLAVPGTSTVGAVKVMPAQFLAGATAQSVACSAVMTAALETTAITSNSSGGNRYDLIYATITRNVTVTGTRKIKSATDGSLSAQTVNLADDMSVTLGVNVGFLTGATAPTAAQIAAATPSDSVPAQGAKYGTYSFPIAYVTVANGYTSGSALFQDSTGGTTFITQCWSRGFVRGHRLRGMRPASIYSGAANEKVTSALAGMTANAERWSSGPHCMFAHCKILSTTGGTLSAGTVLDNNVDWRNRVIWGFWSYTGSASVAPIESTSSGVGMNVTPPEIAGTTLASSVAFTGVLPPAYIQNGFVSGTIWVGQYATSSAASFQMNVNQTGQLVIFKNGFAPLDATNGDLLMFVIYYSDRLRLDI